MTSVSAHSYVTEHRDVSETCSTYQTVTPHTAIHIAVWWATCHVCEVDEPHTDETAATTWCRTHRCVGEEDG